MQAKIGASLNYDDDPMSRAASVRREVSELWLATTFLGGIVLLSGLLHCCVFGGNVHRRGAPLCAEFAAALAQTSGEHSTTATPPKPARSDSFVGPLAAAPLLSHDRTGPDRGPVAARGSCTRRNAMTHGAMRTDDDVGVHDLNTTYRI